MSKPTWDPPEGTHWTLQRGVILYSGNPSVSALNLPPGYDPSGTFYGNFDGITSYGMGSDYSLAGASEYAFERWIYAQFQMYVDGSATELMAAQPDTDSGSQCTSIFASETLSFLDPSVGHTTAWPWRWEFTWHSHSHSAYAGSLGVAVVKIVGDVWTATPGVDDYETISGGDDPDGGGGGGGGGSGGGDIPDDPEADAGLSVRWGRDQTAVVWDLALGSLGGLTWDAEWDDELRMVLDGLHYTVTAIDKGGYSQQAEYRWRQPPGTTATGEPQWFTLDVTPLDDPRYPLR